MITCKEDLVNTYIDNEDGILRTKLYNIMDLFGITYKHPTTEESPSKFLIVGDRYYTYSNHCWNCKQLTLADFEPESPEAPENVMSEGEVTYVKTEFNSLLEALQAVSEGDELYLIKGEWNQPMNDTNLAYLYGTQNRLMYYKKVIVDKREEFIDKCVEALKDCYEMNSSETFGYIYDNVVKGE